MDFPYILEAKRKGKQEYRRFVGKFDSTAKRFETIDREDRSRWFDEHDVSRQPNRVRNFAGFDIFSDNHSARSGQAINRQDFESLPEDGSWEKFASPHASPRSIDFIVPARRCIWRGKISLYSFYLPLCTPRERKFAYSVCRPMLHRFSRLPSRIYHLSIFSTKRKSFLLTYVNAVFKYRKIQVK